MVSFWSILLWIHLLGLTMCVGLATAKVILLVKCYRDVTFVPVYLKVVKPLTQILVLGLILMTLTGIIWLIMGYGFSNTMIVKLVLVAVVWVLGILIDKVSEPKFIRLAPANGEAASPAFVLIQKKHLALETVAALIFYILIIIGEQL
jgi:hypothetical protein